MTGFTERLSCIVQHVRGQKWPAFSQEAIGTGGHSPKALTSIVAGGAATVGTEMCP